MPILALARADYRIVVAVLDRALELRSEHLRAWADYEAARTAGLTSSAITRWIARAFRQR